MNYFTTRSSGRVFVLSLDQGDLLLESVRTLVEKEGIRNGAIISTIGTLDRCTLHMVTTTGYPPVEHFETWTDTALELASMSGIIADGVPHLHAVVSDSRRAYAGHVEEECRVLYLGEIVIMEFAGVDLERSADDKGIKKLRKKET